MGEKKKERKGGSRKESKKRNKEKKEKKNRHCCTIAVDGWVFSDSDVPFFSSFYVYLKNRKSWNPMSCYQDPKRCFGDFFDMFFFFWNPRRAIFLSLFYFCEMGAPKSFNYNQRKKLLSKGAKYTT